MIKDSAIVSLFAKEDLPQIYRLAEKVRATHNISLIDEFDSLCKRKYNDHKSFSWIEPLQVSKTDPDDLLVTTGVSLLIDQIIGASVIQWRYAGAGTDGGLGLALATSNTVLGSENLPRVDMTLFGWRENAATTLRFAAIFGESRATETVKEFGVFTAATAGTMLNREMIVNNPISHTVNVTGYVISSIIEFLPVMS